MGRIIGLFLAVTIFSTIVFSAAGCGRKAAPTLPKKMEVEKSEKRDGADKTEKVDRPAAQ